MQDKTNCKQCDKEIIKIQHNQVYCTDCAVKNYIRPHKGYTEKPCAYCDKTFQPNAPRNDTCSFECRDNQKKSTHYKRNYGITLQEFTNMKEDQDNKCYLCEGDGFLMRVEVHKETLCVDHCHISGKVRGLLCHNCNRGLGLFSDNPELLEKAAKYLRK